MDDEVLSCDDFHHGGCFALVGVEVFHDGCEGCEEAGEDVDFADYDFYVGFGV